MGPEYEVEWDPKALKELRKLDGTIRLQFLKKLSSDRPDHECQVMRFTV